MECCCPNWRLVGGGTIVIGEANVRMPLGINPLVLRAFWSGLVLPGLWLCGLLVFLLFGKGEKRKLCAFWLRMSPVFAIYTAYVLWIVWGLSHHPL